MRSDQMNTLGSISITNDIKKLELFTGTTVPLTLDLNPSFANMESIRLDRNGLPVAIIGRRYFPLSGTLVLYLKTNKIFNDGEIFIECSNNTDVHTSIRVSSTHPKIVNATGYDPSISITGKLDKTSECSYSFTSDLSVDGFRISIGMGGILSNIVYHQGNQITVLYSCPDGQISDNTEIQIKHISTGDLVLVKQKLFVNVE